MKDVQAVRRESVLRTVWKEKTSCKLCHEAIFLHNWNLYFCQKSFSNIWWIFSSKRELVMLPGQLLIHKKWLLRTEQIRNQKPQCTGSHTMWWIKCYITWAQVIADFLNLLSKQRYGLQCTQAPAATAAMGPSSYITSYILSPWKSHPEGFLLGRTLHCKCAGFCIAEGAWSHQLWCC